MGPPQGTRDRKTSCHQRRNSLSGRAATRLVPAPPPQSADRREETQTRRHKGRSGMLEIRHLVKCFGPLVAVDDVSFTVPQGEVLCFLGPNGAGKSTTMKMIAGFLAPTGGTAIVCGYDIGTHPIAAKRHIGYLPEG